MSFLDSVIGWLNGLPWTDQGYLREQARTQYDNAVATHLRDGMSEQEAVYAADARYPGTPDRYGDDGDDYDHYRVRYSADDGWYDDLPDDWADDEADTDGHSR